MIISLIAAMAENRVIGSHGAIPWKLPEDLRRFRSITMGHPVIMGRKTFESIGRPLPDRRNIILTRNPGFTAEGCLVVNSLQAALAVCGEADEVFICGGGEVFRESLPLASRIFLTVVHINVEGDTFFPPIPEDFLEVQREKVEERISFSYILYERKYIL